MDSPEYQAGILTISDRTAAGVYPDAAGPILMSMIAENGGQVAQSLVLPDELELIKQVLIGWADQAKLDLILTTGGTGVGRRDVTPEATLKVVERLVPGIPEAIRQRSLEITPHAMISRSIAGIRGTTLIINLPGSPKGATESLEVVLPVIRHAIQLLRADPGAEAGH